MWGMRYKERYEKIDYGAPTHEERKLIKIVPYTRTEKAHLAIMKLNTKSRKDRNKSQRF